MMHYNFSDKAHIFWDDVIEAVVIRWNSLAQKEDFREPLDKLIELAVMKEAKKVLVDKNHKLVLAEDAQWFSEVWLPKILRAGIQYMAAVTPENTISNSDERHVIGKDITKLRYHEFGNIQNAVHWLAGIPA